MLQAVSGAVGLAVEWLKLHPNWGFYDHRAFSGAYLRPGSSLTISVQLERNVRYGILGSGSDGARDVDLVVRRVRTGEVVASDVEDDARPATDFVPTEAGAYEIVLRIAEGDASGAFVAAAIVAEQGTRIQERDLIASLSRAMLAASVAHSRTGPRAFHEDGGWALQAVPLKGGETMRYTGYNLTGDTIFLARGDDKATDIDVAVESLDGQQQYRSPGPNATPLVRVPGNVHGRHSVSISNPTRGGDYSLVTMLVLDGP